MRSLAPPSTRFVAALLAACGILSAEHLLAADGEAAADKKADAPKSMPMLRVQTAAPVVKAAAEASEGEACEGEACEDGACETDAALADAAAGVVGGDGKVAVHPTHHQTKIISVNGEGLAKADLKSFCLAPDGKILAACDGDSGEVRVFSPAGDYEDTWKLSVKPDAINVGSDGQVYVAGGGKLLRLDSQGLVTHEAASPHLEDTAAKRAEIREQLIARQKQSVEAYAKMSERYDDRLAKLQDKRTKLKDDGEEVPASLDLQINNAERMVEQWKSIVDQLGGGNLTEEQLEQKVNDSLRSASAVASISESGGDVFIATREAAGYGFCVWKLDHEFTSGEVIVKGLSGCCGQMDVQCCENGIYVAENSRHRVYHLDAAGEELGQWGHGARDGLEGFGSCCNPMNVAFGPDRTVYTAESGTGRIKRYSPEGELLELVGKVDIVPGCKKVSIAVDKSGDRVYMLDITRHHIVMMERVPEGDEAEYTEYRTVKADADEAAAAVGVDAVLTY
ncbi:SMP-30/Gluconolaconase/LRE-like region [Posidoniimonas corsicana]|uniref:SMP-30/Gluconolaconase/LRE-like region n=1 Tax=Posidoniimonas corsicana TaxID=1938618 RepID=A0A5C5UY59_9BACT|nr:hypothetical protein [Posidoniimonas corsicana]TWT31181.1 SMP-30/Gluconolaconase/LRE-like region [Posidoniimonas corsicana]